MSFSSGNRSPRGGGGALTAHCAFGTLYHVHLMSVPTFHKYFLYKTTNHLISLNKMELEIS